MSKTARPAFCTVGTRLSLLGRGMAMNLQCPPNLCLHQFSALIYDATLDQDVKGA